MGPPVLKLGLELAELLPEEVVDAPLELGTECRNNGHREPPPCGCETHGACVEEAPDAGEEHPDEVMVASEDISNQAILIWVVIIGSWKKGTSFRILASPKKQLGLFYAWRSHTAIAGQR